MGMCTSSEKFELQVEEGNFLLSFSLKFMLNILAQISSSLNNPITIYALSIFGKTFPPILSLSIIPQ